jgi:Flp pilus assembly pilin Flp
MSIIAAVSLLGNGVDGMWDRMTTSLSAPLGNADGDD